MSVRIEHSFVGDLPVWLERDGFEHVLHDRTGDDADDLMTTYTLELPEGLPLDGQWRRHVTDQADADQADADQGRLLRWDLVLR
jgi:subtilisin-like proprotein convertase family protein